MRRVPYHVRDKGTLIYRTTHIVGDPVYKAATWNCLGLTAPKS